MFSKMGKFRNYRQESVSYQKVLDSSIPSRSRPVALGKPGRTSEEHILFINRMGINAAFAEML